MSVQSTKITELQVQAVLFEMRVLRDHILQCERHQYSLLVLTFSITSAFLVLMFYYQIYTIALLALLILILIGLSFVGEMIIIAEAALYLIAKEEELNRILGGHFVGWEHYVHSPPRKLWGITYRCSGLASVFGVTILLFVVLGAIFADFDLGTRLVVAIGYLPILILVGLRVLSHLRYTEQEYYRGIIKKPGM